MLHITRVYRRALRVRQRAHIVVWVCDRWEVGTECRRLSLLSNITWQQKGPVGFVPRVGSGKVKVLNVLPLYLWQKDVYCLPVEPCNLLLPQKCINMKVK